MPTNSRSHRGNLLCPSFRTGHRLAGPAHHRAPARGHRPPRAAGDPPGKIVFPGFPADDLYHFRLYSLAAQLIMWAVIGVGFAWPAPRLLGEHAELSQSGAPVQAA
ncbi:CbtA family protein [Nocardia acidivorans]|uniref:CbtA family protein n=1 Tax=Nocardia acidivorans TaxID=404580 RepID=UPI000A01B359